MSLVFLVAQAQTCWAAILNHLPGDSCLRFSSGNSAFSPGMGFPCRRAPRQDSCLFLTHTSTAPHYFSGAPDTSTLPSPQISALAGDRRRGQRCPFPKRSVISVISWTQQRGKHYFNPFVAVRPGSCQMQQTFPDAPGMRGSQPSF